VRGLARWRSALVAIAVACAVAACFVRVYRTPYHARAVEVTLLVVYR
jgi:hypothetical protein